MRTLLAFLLVNWLMTSAPSLATHGDPPAKELPKAPPQSLEVHLNYVTEAEAEPILKTLASVDTLLKGNFNPPQVRANLTDVLRMPRHSTGQLFLGAKIPVDEKGKTSGRFSAVPEPIWAHEYGHAYFDAALRESCPEWKKWAEEAQKQVPLPGQLFPEYSPAELKKIQKQMMDSKELTILKQLTRPYDELFADMVAVVVLKDGKAMKKAFDAWGAPDADERDFTIDHPVVKKEGGWNLGDAHGVLSPARSAIWKKYEEEAKSPKFSPGAFVGTVYKVMESEILDRLKDSNPLAMNPKEANQRLVAAIRNADYSKGRGRIR